MASAPGKTAPRLIQDILTYDPRYEERAGRNLLTSPPPHHNPDASPVPAVSSRNCRHDLRVKQEQSALVEGSGPESGKIYKIATFCSKCRWHVDVHIDYRDDGDRSTPCRQASEDYTLHHFIFKPVQFPNPELLYGNPLVPRAYAFECSAPKCPVALQIRMLPPRFPDHDIRLLTDRAVLRRRLETARDLVGDRADNQMARSVDALDFLSTYLNDSLNPQKGKTKIPILNRKFVKTFGKDCDQILAGLGFEYEEETPDDDGNRREVWRLPQPPESGHPLDQDTKRTVILDAKEELNVLLLGYTEAERSGVRYTPKLPPSANIAIERALGSENYQKKSLVGTRSANREEDHPYYAGLGAVGDFSDALLLFAYSRQVAVDLGNATYYFECLQDLALGRKSEMLENQVQLLASKGQASRKDVAYAYRALGMDPEHANHIGDDHIIGQFKARLQDISPSVAEETRNYLRVIGNARNSEKIMQEASNAIETFEQAVAWLDLPDENCADEFVETMYTVKTSDQPANIEVANRAVSIIATRRQSSRLQNFLVTGTVAASAFTGMDTAEAYSFLQIADRASTLDLEILRQQILGNIDDNPSSKDKYEEAYRLVELDQKSKTGSTQNMLDESSKYDPHWPVGCVNIGNTCYLNSVLQFLFTIRPLRERILNCDEHFETPSDEVLERKTVGRMKITAKKVERAQQFVHELRSLFQQMITATTPRVRPEPRLAALALSRDGVPVANPQARDTSTATPLGQIGGVPVAGPMLPPEMVAASKPDQPSTDSPETLVDTPMGDDVNAKDDTSSMDAQLDPDEDSPMEMEDLTKGTEVANGGDKKPEPPTRPPPVPPRPFDWKEIEGLAQQQDAAEILNNVFDLLSSAFKADSTMDDGEQWDFVKELFFSTVTAVRMTGSKTSQKSDLQDTHHVAAGERDRSLYAALDDEFSLSEQDEVDKQMGVKPKKYEYMVRAAPIQIINVRRAIYDRETLKLKKSEAHLALEDVLYLDRYLEETGSLNKDQLLQLKKNQWQLQDKLKALEKKQNTLRTTELKSDLSDAVHETAEFLDGMNAVEDAKLIDAEMDPHFPDLSEKLRVKAEALAPEARDVDQQMQNIDAKISTIFEDCYDQPYVLHAVFMHRGTGTSGHYWIYIRDVQEDLWREYNDEGVRLVEDPGQIFARVERTTSTGLVYVRKMDVHDLTQAVCRQPEKTEPKAVHPQVEQTQQSGDVEMVEIPVIEGVEPAKSPVIEGAEKTVAQIYSPTGRKSFGVDHQGRVVRSTRSSDAANFPNHGRGYQYATAVDNQGAAAKSGRKEVSDELQNDEGTGFKVLQCSGQSDKSSSSSSSSSSDDQDLPNSAGIQIITTMHGNTDDRDLRNPAHVQTITPMYGNSNEDLRKTGCVEDANDHAPVFDIDRKKSRAPPRPTPVGQSEYEAHMEELLKNEEFFKRHSRAGPKPDPHVEEQIRLDEMYARRLAEEEEDLERGREHSPEKRRSPDSSEWPESSEQRDRKKPRYVKIAPAPPRRPEIDPPRRPVSPSDTEDYGSLHRQLGGLSVKAWGKQPVGVPAPALEGLSTPITSPDPPASAGGEGENVPAPALSGMDISIAPFPRSNQRKGPLAANADLDSVALQTMCSGHEDCMCLACTAGEDE